MTVELLNLGKWLEIGSGKTLLIPKYGYLLFLIEEKYVSFGKESVNLDIF